MAHFVDTTQSFTYSLILPPDVIIDRGSVFHDILTGVYLNFEEPARITVTTHYTRWHRTNERMSFVSGGWVLHVTCPDRMLLGRFCDQLYAAMVNDPATAHVRALDIENVVS